MRLHPAPGMPRIRPVHGPSLYPASNWLDLIDESSSWWRELGFLAPYRSFAAWDAIVRWADKHDRPIQYVTPTRGGHVLECFDEDTIETVCAWVLSEQTRLGSSVITIGRSDGDLGWHLPTSTREHEEHSPAARQLHLATEVVSRLWDRGHTTTRVVIQAYGLTAIVPHGATVHPGIAVVVMGPAYLPSGMSMPQAITAWRTAGARTVQPYAYWSSWARGEPGDAMILDNNRLAEALTWPRYSDDDPDLLPDCLHGAVHQWLTQYAPAICALAVLKVSRPSPSDVAAAKAEWIRQCFGSSGYVAVARWYHCMSEPSPLTRGVVLELYQALEVAYDSIHPDRVSALLPLVAHTRYLDLRLAWLRDPGLATRDALVRWLWTTAQLHVYDLRILQLELDFRQGAPEDDWTQDPDAADMRALVTRRALEIDPMPWEPEPQRVPITWRSDDPPAGAVGTLGPYWQAGILRPGRWFVGVPESGIVQLTVADLRWDVPFIVQLLDRHGGIQIEREITTAETIVIEATPGDTLELRIEGSGWYRLTWHGAPHAYTPDPTATRGSVGTVRGYVWVPAGTKRVGLYVHSWAKVWTAGLPRRWNLGHTHDLEAGEHTIEVSSVGQWIAISGAHWVVLAGARPWISRRPGEGAIG